MSGTAANAGTTTTTAGLPSQTVVVGSMPGTVSAVPLKKTGNKKITNTSTTTTKKAGMRLASNGSSSLNNGNTINGNDNNNAVNGNNTYNNGETGVVKG